MISLDFELHWGVAETADGADSPYAANIRGARDAVPALLELFHERDIHATWAVVGKLFADGADDLESFNPLVRPHYEHNAVDTYRLRVGSSEADDPLHFAPNLIRKVHATPGQELATHTFCHYYCGEPGQDVGAFRYDLEAARAIAARDKVELRSLVLPRNQVIPSYLAVMPAVGLDVYRGNPPGAMYQLPRGAVRRHGARAVRLVDSFINLTGQHTVPWSRIVADPYAANVQASRFLRPYSRKLRFLEPLRRRRVIAGLRTAAERGEIFHLWWHPHNFGTDLPANLAALTRILDEFEQLRERYGMCSLTMAEAADVARVMIGSRSEAP